MAFSWSISLALFCILQALPVLGNPNCPVYGPEFPKPRNLAEGEAWKAAMKNLSATFDSVEAGGQNYSFSVQVFSTNPGPPILFERFHTADTIPSNTTGVKKIDAATVYRIGSVTKLFTALTFLAEAGDKHWNQPITDFIPELAEMTTADPSRGGVRYVDWSDVNVLSLLSQMSGIERDYMVLGEVVGSINASDAIAMGFPPLAAEPPCGKNPLCNRTQFFEGMKTMYPSFAPWTTPAYSDIAFQLLSYVLENITGRPFNVSLAEKVLKPLGLSHTFLQGANESMGIVPRLSDSRSWKVHIGDLNPSGNIFSSAGDMSKFGMAVLNSTLLKPLLTRRWLKPMSYSSDIVAAVGAPWGLRRLHLSSVNPHRTVTAFTKAGGVDPYSALLTIIPEFNIGFTVLIAGGDTAGLIWKFIDYLTGAVIPALDAASREDARARYGGEYRAEGLNSSLTIDTDPSKPGLGVSNWLSNGTNMIVSALETQSGMAVPSEPNALNSTQPSTRLYFTGLESPSASGKVLQSFKAIFETLGGPSNPGTGISTDCGTWIGYTGVTYAGLPLDEFIFELDSAGDATSVTNLALNVTLIRIKK